MSRSDKVYNHGTRTRYARGCRCDQCCLAAKTQKKKQLRAHGATNPYALPQLPPFPGWMESGACRDLTLEERECFFPPSGFSTDIKEALQYCDVCPVKRECLEFALELNFDNGVWGGTSGRDRRRIRKRRAA